MHFERPGGGSGMHFGRPGRGLACTLGARGGSGMHLVLFGKPTLPGESYFGYFGKPTFAQKATLPTSQNLLWGKKLPVYTVQTYFSYFDFATVTRFGPF